MAATRQVPTRGASAVTTPSPGAAVTDLAAIGCATEDPTGVGELTGAWQGNDSGVYYIRHVGDCVWWFGTEVDDIEPGVTGQPGFANVAAGRMVGTQIDLEWADVPIGYILNGGGLTFVYDERNRHADAHGATWRGATVRRHCAHSNPAGGESRCEPERVSEPIAEGRSDS